MRRKQDQVGIQHLSRLLHGLRFAATIPVLIYQKLISPALPPHCIYTPSCSEYTRKAILAHGLPGAFAGLMRLLRCIGGLYAGGDDPVPQRITLRAVFGAYRRFWAVGRK